MDDTISRAAVLEVIREYCPDEPKSKDLREYWKKRFEPLIKVREEIEKMPLSDGWVPVSERSPEKTGEYFVTIKWSKYDYEVDCYEYNADCGEWNDGELFGGTVVAWIGKPAPWKGE